ncbi:MAG: ABC transporter, partial [Methylophilales bacterium 16-45-7]
MTKQLKKLFFTIALATMLVGCASANNKDPLEGINRGIYKFNDVADRGLIKPVATAYKTVT